MNIACARSEYRLQAPHIKYGLGPIGHRTLPCQFVFFSGVTPARRRS
jgi:hypothetical protein